MAASSDPVADRKTRIRDALVKSNAEYQKITSAILTFSTALLAFPILFFKDISRESIPAGSSIFLIISAQKTWLIASVALSWTCLVLSMLCCLNYSSWSGFALEKAYEKFDPEAYYESSKGRKISSKLNFYFYASFYFFVAGLSLMLVFVLFYVKQTSSTAASAMATV